MKFGPVPTEKSEGCILAHSIQIEGKKFRKGRQLSRADIEAIQKFGLASVIVASLEEGDLDEDAAALRIAKALTAQTENLTYSAPFTGRVNLHANCEGIVDINVHQVLEVNSIDERITLATRSQYDRVSPHSLVATVKVITYAVKETSVESAEKAALGAIDLRIPILNTASLILTQTTGQSERVVKKGVDAVIARLDRLGILLTDTQSVQHQSDEITEAIRKGKGQLVLLLTGAATSDSEDEGPKALRQAGGQLFRFGMPVDPGNLLFFGAIGNRSVIGLPGCARSLSLNGADWVLERVACGVSVNSHDIATMGVGGLLKEIPTRPQSRTASSNIAKRPFVEVAVILIHKSHSLLPLVKAAVQSKADRVRIISEQSLDNNVAVKFPNVPTILSYIGSGRSGLVQAAVGAIDSMADAIVLMPTDSVPVSSDQIDKLISAFSPSDGREICRIAQTDGRQRPPTLFGKRFFESLAELSGARGANTIVSDAEEFTVEIQP